MVRQPWLCLLLFGVLMMALTASAQSNDADTRPNIVFAFADDWGQYASVYGRLHPGGPNDVVSTPHFDGLAKNGVLFRNAFVNAPSCTPCRSSLLSGQYFWRTGRGAILSGAVWDSKIPTYPLLLKAAGYHIGHTYKVWSPGTPANAPYGAQATAYNSAGRRFNGFSQFVSGKPDTAAAKQVLLDEVRGNFAAFLKDRESKEPFCYWFGPTNCHRKWIRGSGKKLWNIDPDDLKGKLPHFLPDVPEIREDFADYLGEVQAFDAGLGVLIEHLKAIGEYDNTLIVVSGDHGIPGFPRGKCNLYDFGTQVPLLVHWPGHVPGNRVVDDFVCLPDLAPTFLEAAGVDRPEVMTGHSLWPLLTSADQGQVDPSRDAVIVGRERHVSGARTNHLPYPQRAIRTRDYLFVRNFKPNRWPMGTAPGYGEPAGPFPDTEKLTQQTFQAFADLDASPTKAWVIDHRDEPGMKKFFDYAFARHPEFELYDLAQDPDQIDNVAGQAQYAEIQKSLRSRLMSVLQETGDPRVTGDGSTFDRPPFSTPAEPGKRRARQSQKSKLGQPKDR